jgi:hypothetical protein
MVDSAIDPSLNRSCTSHHFTNTLYNHIFSQLYQNKTTSQQGSPPASSFAASQQPANEKSALFISGSNADRLAHSAATVGVNPETVTSGGWILTTATVTTILPDIEAFCNSMPADSPVVIYCFDNSSFACADQDGAISAIRKLGKGTDNNYHVVRELSVAHEITLAAAVTNLKRIIAVCGGRLVIIVTPFPRTINGKSCDADDHCTHLAVPESREKIFNDLRRLHTFITCCLSTAPNC